MDTAELLVILQRALERRRLLAENRELRARPRAGARLPSSSWERAHPMLRLFRDIEKVAGSDASVLISGESGTGKELVARSVHAGSPRRDRAVRRRQRPRRCRSRWPRPSSSGTRRAPSPARSPHGRGGSSSPHGGTLFLDEIGTLSPAVQSKLLRALESREIERVGGRRPIPVDFRLISATNENLEARVAAGSFREDLFYRIHTVPIVIPPLRERVDDIPLLADHFLARFCARHGKPGKRLSPGVLDALEAHPWRGNVRELAACRRDAGSLLRRRRGRGGGPAAGAARAGRSRGRGSSARAEGFAAAVEEFERRLLTDAIAASNGVKAEAARRLGLDGNQIKYLCRKYGL